MSDKNLTPFLEMMGPLVRLLLEAGISYQETSALLKEAYVGVATDHFGKGGRPTNVSRVSLLTGIDRKEVKRVQAQRAAAQGEARLEKTDRITRLLAAWHQDPDFIDPKGQPRTLSSAPEGDFWALMHRYAGNVPHVAFLRELVRVRAVAVDGEQVTPLARTYIPPVDDPEVLWRSAEVLSDVGKTMVHNLFESRPGAERHFERRVVHREAPLAIRDAFHALVRERGQALLEELDDWLEQHTRAAPQAGSTVPHTARIGLGMYLIDDAGER